MATTRTRGLSPLALCAGVAGLLYLCAPAAGAHPRQQMPRDAKPGAAPAVTQEETNLQRKAGAAGLSREESMTLAKLQLNRGAFDDAVDTLEHAAALDPSNPVGYHLVGTFYFEKSRDQTLDPEVRRTYLERGAAAEDRALALNPDYVEALVYKNLFLRTQAVIEPDPATKQALVREADTLRTRALELRKSQQPAPEPPSGAVMLPPPPPPPPPPSGRP